MAAMRSLGSVTLRCFNILIRIILSLNPITTILSTHSSREFGDGTDTFYKDLWMDFLHEDWRDTETGLTVSKWTKHGLTTLRIPGHDPFIDITRCSDVALNPGPVFNMVKKPPSS